MLGGGEMCILAFKFKFYIGWNISFTSRVYKFARAWSSDQSAVRYIQTV